MKRFKNVLGVLFVAMLAAPSTVCAATGDVVAQFPTPGRCPTGLTYDSGRYAEILDRALAKADRDGFSARRAASAAAGRLRGLGMAYYVERCGVGGTETARIRFEASGEAVLYVGT